MGKKKSVNDLYWESKKEDQIRREYEKYLAREKRESDPDVASYFAAEKIAGGHEYRGYSERDLIILLAGKLPYMWD